MGLEQLVARLERDAATRVAAVEAKAREEIAALDAAEAREAFAREAEVLATKRAARTAASERELSLARRRAHADVLGARQAVLERAMARALELLDDANADESYRATVADRVVRALEFTSGPAVVRCRPDLAEIVRGTLADVVCEDATLSSGFVVEAAALVIDETLAARLARMRDVLATELGKELGDG